MSVSVTVPKPYRACTATVSVTVKVSVIVTVGVTLTVIVTWLNRGSDVTAPWLYRERDCYRDHDCKCDLDCKRDRYRSRSWYSHGHGNNQVTLTVVLRRVSFCHVTPRFHDSNVIFTVTCQSVLIFSVTAFKSILISNSFKLHFEPIFWFSRDFK